MKDFFNFCRKSLFSSFSIFHKRSIRVTTASDKLSGSEGRVQNFVDTEIEMYYFLLDGMTTRCLSEGNRVMTGPLFSRMEMSDIFKDINPRTLRSWLDMGLVEWTSEKRDRRGANRLYSIEGLYQVEIIKELASANIPLLSVRTIIHIHFPTATIREKMKQIFGIAKRPGNDLTFYLADPSEAGKALAALSGPRRGAKRQELENGKYTSIGIGDTSPATLIIVLNLPQLKYRVDTAVSESAG